MAILEWMRPQMEAIEAANGILERLRGKKGRTIKPTEPVVMGGDGSVVLLGVVVGRRVGVELKPGVIVDIQGKARAVQAADGGIMAVAGGEGESISVYEARRVLPKQGVGEVEKALARNRRVKRKKLGV